MILSENACRGMGIMSAQLAAHYRSYAIQCLTVARRQECAGDRLALINMAQAWVALAELTEKIESLFLKYGVPDDIGDKDDDPAGLTSGVCPTASGAYPTSKHNCVAKPNPGDYWPISPRTRNARLFLTKLVARAEKELRPGNGPKA
jgi:hypothetical protein